jgi:hypothetical protein
MAFKTIRFSWFGAFAVAFPRLPLQALLYSSEPTFSCQGFKKDFLENFFLGVQTPSQ